MQWIKIIVYVNSHPMEPRFYSCKFSYWIMPVIFPRNVVKFDVIVVIWSATCRGGNQRCYVKAYLQL